VTEEVEADEEVERVVDESENLVSFKDFTLAEVLGQKKNLLGQALVSVREHDTVYHALEVMEKYGIGAVLVHNGAPDNYIGIFTERDYLRSIALRGRSSKATSVADVMTRDLEFATTADLATKVMRQMTQARFRHIPVKDEASGKLVGLISIGDLMKAVLTQLAESAVFLRDMVTGKYTKG